MTMTIEAEEDVVAVRQRARQISEHLGFQPQDQTRIATAVSEIARNAFGYAKGGKVEFGVDEREGAQIFSMQVSDRGPGIADLPIILESRYTSSTGLGIGIMGARRLLDVFDIETRAGGGTAVSLGKKIPLAAQRFDAAAAAAMGRVMTRRSDDNPSAVLREQNRELLLSLAALSDKEEEARRLNRELEATNRGVVALHAELEDKAEALRVAGETLEMQVEARTQELADANVRLKAEAETRQRMEADLRQAQKMEAVGQLTGGIAHDFNNLLTGIVGSLDLLRRRIKQNRLEKIDGYIDMAMGSAERASALTHRLLAFARRQPLNPKPIEINALIAGMRDLLRRTINEAIDLDFALATDDCVTLCDAHQLENAVLNLVINARDAMPTGGSLTIATTAVRMGAEPDGVKPYVCVSVADTGTGMTPDVMARAFDPFFTTKPLGQGTGLGLSMIYGFARQSGGLAEIESEVGRGTLIRILLPAFVGTAPAKADAATDPVPDGLGEAILVVEDEATVRELVVEALIEAGYRVSSVVDGASALEHFQRPEPIDLLITDVGLPGLNGRQVADAARTTRPNLGVLFITGYAEEAAISGGFLDAGMEIITKPFPIDRLLKRVGLMLANRGEPVQSSCDAPEPLDRSTITEPPFAS